MDDYQSHDAVGLAELVRDKKVSAAELLAAARARAAEVNDRINAIVVDVDPPPAGDGPPFAGVPFLLKDLGHDLEGYPTSGGSRSLSTTPAAENATVVQRWLDAGLVVFGKTNTPEFGAKGVTEPHLFGPARNPWNTDHTPGGSSGGAAAAVAAGIVPCAAASDGGGSIRIPASACGLFGLKPSRGLVPAGPLVQEGMGGAATSGVDLALGPRHRRDARRARRRHAGRALPPGPARDAVRRRGRPGPRHPPHRAVHGQLHQPEPDPEAVAAATQAGELLESLGHHVEHLDRAPFDDEALAKDFLTTWFVYAADSVAQAKAASGSGDSGFEPDTLVMAALGRATNPVDLVRAIENRQLHVRRLAEFHESYDLLLTPSTALPPPRIGQLDLPPGLQKAQKALVSVRGAGLLRFTPVVDQLISENLGWVPYTQLANLTGRPAMSVPLHWTAAGLPIGAQLVGRLGADGQLLRLAAQLEQAQPWADRRPPLSAWLGKFTHPDSY